MKHDDHNYFYVKRDEVFRDEFYLSGEEFHHATKALRLEEGSFITAVDGNGNEYSGIISEIVKGERAKCSILKTRRKPKEPSLDLTLVQALLKGDRFDYLVEKAVEIGVNTIIPLHAARCIVSANVNKIDRWKRIAVSAMKQSHRSILPEITNVMEFDEMVAYSASASGKIILQEDAKSSLARQIERIRSLRPLRSLTLVVGPEGDFTREEIETAYAHSFEPASLGPRRLRSETAGIVAIAAIFAQETY